LGSVFFITFTDFHSSGVMQLFTSSCFLVGTYEKKRLNGRELGLYWHFVDLFGYLFYSFLSSLILKVLLCHTNTNMYQIPVKSGKFSGYIFSYYYRSNFRYS
jgi:hypothetical protein